MSDGPTPIAGIVLAAGISTRFGANKLRAPLKGKPLIRNVAEAALASRLARLFVVLGHEADEVGAALGGLADDRRLEIIVNPDYADGQSTTVRTGLEAARRDYAAVMFLMGDQPLLDASIIDALIHAFQASDKDICYPSHQGRRRNPVIFSQRFFSGILALTGDTGARALIDANPHATCVVDFAEEAAFRDVDREADLRALDGWQS
jgi:molybdenum cofactor cytidylyltransferase